MVLIFALLLSMMAMISYYWQQYTQLHLLEFALGVMSFAYAPLLGVYGAAIFTDRGNQMTVIWALIGGFLTVLMLQPYILELLFQKVEINFAAQIIIGTVVSFMMMMTGKARG